jgi:hypothetical protein
VDEIAKLTVCISLILASAFFLSATVLEQQQRNKMLQELSNDTWCRQRISEAFPEFTAIILNNVTDTSAKLKESMFPNMAQAVVSKLGWQPEYYRMFMAYQKEPDPIQYEPANHYHWDSSQPI